MSEKVVAFRIAFRCDPYRARTHFLWINAFENTDYGEIRQAAYKYKDGLSVDVIDEVYKWSYAHDKPHIDLTQLSLNK